MIKCDDTSDRMLREIVSTASCKLAAVSHGLQPMATFMSKRLGPCVLRDMPSLEGYDITSLDAAQDNHMGIETDTHASDRETSV